MCKSRRDLLYYKKSVNSQFIDISLSLVIKDKKTVIDIVNFRIFI